MHCNKCSQYEWTTVISQTICLTHSNARSRFILCCKELQTSKNCPFDCCLNQRILLRQVFASHYNFSAAECQVFPGMRRRNPVTGASFQGPNLVAAHFPWAFWVAQKLQTQELIRVSYLGPEAWETDCGALYNAWLLFNIMCLFPSRRWSTATLAQCMVRIKLMYREHSLSVFNCSHRNPRLTYFWAFFILLLFNLCFIYIIQTFLFLAGRFIGSSTKE